MIAEPEKVALFSDATMLQHRPGPHHPDAPERLRRLFALLDAQGRSFVSPPEAPREALMRVHDPAHIDSILSLRGQSHTLDPDTHLSPGSVHAALLSAGAALAATSAVLNDTHPAQVAAALTRPPGHHATRAQAMGFCVFNNLALGVEAALLHPEVSRVLVVDWDVHHGNGTASSFRARSDVMVFDTHQSPFYPGSGDVSEVGMGPGRGQIHNIPLVAGASGGDLHAAFVEALVPAADTFRPDIIFIAAGFDAHTHDPLGGLDVSTEDFAALAGVVHDIAQRHCNGRVVLTLEGGYNPDALAESFVAVLGVLEGTAPPPPSPPTGHARRSLSAYRAARPVRA